jgi:hypothetical protein
VEVEMLRVQEAPVAAPLVMLMLAQPVLGQNSLDLKQADARNAAHTIMSVAEKRFDCRFEEYAMQDVGNEPNIRYIFHVTTKGDECGEALLLVTNMATREDRLLFREVQVEDSKQQVDHSLLQCRRSHAPHGDLLICDDQLLIHEVNPEMDGNDLPEE